MRSKQQRQRNFGDPRRAIDPALRADALFNRGNSALAAQAFGHAVRDYVDVLKLRPDHAAAKRNLEIALRQRENAERAAGQRDQGGQQQKQQPKSNQPQNQPPRGEMDLGLLRRATAGAGGAPADEGQAGEAGGLVIPLWRWLERCCSSRRRAPANDLIVDPPPPDE
jgi:tetratricopeptide (TPR) repeat protein